MGIRLDADQQLALNHFIGGKSIAIFGGGGCGKSVLLNVILEYARRTIGKFPKATSCALSTHAAERIGGRTIYSLFGAPPFWPISATLWDIIKNRKEHLSSLKKMKVLVIDEVTLLSDRILDTLDVVLRNAVDDPDMSTAPFRGRQVVFAGDPFQLQPIVDRSMMENTPVKSSSYLAVMCLEEYNRRAPGPIQNSLCWYLAFGGFGSGVIVFLSNNHRQQGDKDFFEILSRIRVGTVKNSDIERLNRLSSSSCNVPLGYTCICLRRKAVAAVNLEMLQRIPGPLHKSVAEDRIMQLHNDRIQ